MGQTLKIAPATEPVTLAEAKLHCKVDGVEHDAMFNTVWIPSARQQAELRTGRALVTQQWEYTLEGFLQRIALPMPALVSVQSVKYLDQNGALQTLASTEYQVVISELVGYIIPAYGKAWPGCRTQPDSVVIAYTAGYGLPAAVPPGIKAWMLMAITTMYNQRDVVIAAAAGELPRDFFTALLDPYWVPGA